MSDDDPIREIWTADDGVYVNTRKTGWTKVVAPIDTTGWKYVSAREWEVDRRYEHVWASCDGSNWRNLGLRRRV